MISRNVKKLSQNVKILSRNVNNINMSYIIYKNERKKIQLFNM
jgi:hypothetical protein